jgi:hypothetical protein
MDGGQPRVMFDKPAHERAWATRAVLGEEQWIAERPLDTAMPVDIAATAAALVAVVATRRHRAMPAAAATALEMGLLMAYWAECRICRTQKRGAVFTALSGCGCDCAWGRCSADLRPTADERLDRVGVGAD